MFMVKVHTLARHLASAADAPAPQPPPGEEGEDAAAAVAAPTWAGDTALLADLGLPAEELTATAEGFDPAGALVEVGERCGFANLLEAVR
jgi:putative tRNA adenosine deaminase-associated protein